MRFFKKFLQLKTKNKNNNKEKVFSFPYNFTMQKQCTALRHLEEKDTDGVWNTGVQTVNDALQLFL